MALLLIEDFKSGLDTRRSVFTAPPGSLRVLNNGHISRGGEIEKRRAFAETVDLEPNTVGGDTFGLHASNGLLFTFGSEAPGNLTLPAGISYQQLVHKDGNTAIKAVLDVDNFAGKIYAIAEFTDGAIYHYYDGERVTDWDAIAQSLSDSSEVADEFASRFQASTDFQTSTSSNVLTVTAPVAGVGFSYQAGVSGPGRIETTVVQSNVEATGEELAVGGFDITDGSDASAGTNTITSVRVDGIEVLGASVDWTDSNSNTAGLVADQINAYSSTVEYTAYADGARVQIEALAGTGSGPNGFSIATATDGDFFVQNGAALAGGVDGDGAVAQVVEFTFQDFDIDNVYELTLDGTRRVVQAQAVGTGDTALTFGDKVYSATQSVVWFSGFTGTPARPDPTAWDENVDGSNFLNIATKDGGFEELTAIGQYQDQLAFFSRRSVQIWSVQADPSKSQLVQTLPNVGTIAPGSVTSFGNVDVFFLSESGIRSLQARGINNLANAQDVGTPIDGDVVEHILSVGPGVARRAQGIVEPNSARFLLNIDRTIYVFTRFEGSDVSAWSTYDVGGEVIAWATLNGRVHARVGDKVLTYGGATGEDYDATECQVTFPFLDGGNPTQEKTLMGFDIGCLGDWKVEVAMDPTRPDVFEPVAEVSSSSYGHAQRLTVHGVSTHFAFRLTSTNSGPALLANFAIHFQGGDTG